MPGKLRSRSSRRKVYRRRQRGGAGEEGMQKAPGPLPAAAGGSQEAVPATGPPADAATMTGGRRSRSRTGGRKAKKGGEGIIATAALPFGLLALHRYFKGSRSTKKNMRGLGNTFKRTCRRRR